MASAKLLRLWNSYRTREIQAGRGRVEVSIDGTDDGKPTWVGGAYREVIKAERAT